ncbi:hypothetical protein CDAR_211961 [Caerostris darwini]|uniref:Uncharacterized protein n=1 Tax=Caerostris darwini TaxID=1538125 RepID=A0AAV4PFW9_9ARAC|nr:hypothetical protein CDAR_211961 [Caerostris darwini]
MEKGVTDFVNSVNEAFFLFQIAMEKSYFVSPNDMKMGLSIVKTARGSELNSMGTPLALQTMGEGHSTKLTNLLTVQMSLLSRDGHQQVAVVLSDEISSLDGFIRYLAHSSGYFTRLH